ncbi:MAG: sugar phosphate nucleotidyltransferase [Bacteroides sp.]|nr:sugar phosphate nucleotidyltransferase [Eubacterium sp.]MCM1418260.1 sugar phosphate nucleotidyltransferase [Roseburia sp.]MCM1462358.1 sugar phosphate nucleotidyltransferase [Bacteroides sp.]
MKAVILAGGEGTRLRPMTCAIPKPMIPICGKPVIEYILDLLARHGCREAVIAVRYKKESLERRFAAGSYKGISLGFSEESDPLGTAGCVKKAAADFDEDFLVISGDAICDFDLGEAFRFHRSSGADATILTKRVDDPREYGLIIEKNGVITDFSEKPSYINCRSDLANTGIYLLSPKILRLIPAHEMWDFAKNVFPDMLGRRMRLMSFEAKGYWCDIGDIGAYKRCSTDLLEGRVSAALPPADPKERRTESGADKSLILPGARVARDAVLGGLNVVGENVSVGAGARLHNAILMDGAFVGENTTLNDCIICTNARIESGAAVYENAVVGDNSVIGEDAVICGGIRVWPEKTVEKGAFVNNDRKYGVKSTVEITEDGIVGETNTVITPEFAGRLGCAIARITKNYAAVSCSEENAAETLKNALLSGISSTGRQCFDCGNVTLPVLSHSAGLLNCDIVVHISAKTRTRILIYNKGLLPLSRAQERLLENALTRGEYLSASWNHFSSINKFTGSLSLYTAALESLTDFTVPYRITLSCLNSRSAAIYTPFLNKIGTGKEELTLTLNEKNTKAELTAENGERLDYCSMLLLAADDAMREGKEVALPYSFPQAADYVAERHGMAIRRFYASSLDDGDREAREIATEQSFLYDGFILAATVLRSLADRAMTIGDAIGSLPKFSEMSRFIHISCPPQKILKKLMNGENTESEGVVISEDGERIFMRSNKKGTGLYLFAESFNSETAAQLCEKAEKMIKTIMRSDGSEEMS